MAWKVESGNNYPMSEGISRKTDMVRPIVFISYSHKDEIEKEALLAHLRVLQYADLIDLWSDDRIGPGSDWEQEIDQAMARARVAILLISANFLTSDFILQEEVPRLLERRNQEGLTIFPVIAKPCTWDHVEWLKQLNVRPENGVAVWGPGSYIDAALATIAEEVAQIIVSSKDSSITPDSVLTKTQSAIDSQKFQSQPEVAAGGDQTNRLLSIKEKIWTERSQLIYEVERFLGGGSQGEVYELVREDQSVALKWYSAQHLQHDTRLKERLETSINLGPPSDRFLWPLDIAGVLNNDIPGFGYIMPLLEPGYRNLFDLMKRLIDPSFRVLATTGFELAQSYRQLHQKGLCYRNISLGHVFFDPDTGEVRLGNNESADLEEQAGIISGSPRLMAPELVRGDAHPSRRTDRFSLAVLIFYILMVHHPLEGKREREIASLDLPAMRKLYGHEPVFIFHPTDNSNAPLSDYHQNARIFWPIYPQFLRKIFTQVFTEGLHNPEHRLSNAEWQVAMVRLRDSIYYCANCGLENFYDIEALKATDGKPGRCWSCQTGLRLPPRICIGKNVVMLNYDTQLFPHHVDDQQQFNFLHPIAEVTRHPQHPDTWGLKNLSQENWQITTGSRQIVPPDRSVTLLHGMRINFGKLEGEIRAK
jgi:serine/threonine protein kinase